MRILILLILFSLNLGVLSLNSQNSKNIISGIVISQYNYPLVGVIIKVKETNTSTISNNNGCFYIEANVGSVIEFSQHGYISQEYFVSKNMIPDSLTQSEKISEHYIELVNEYNKNKIYDESIGYNKKSIGYFSNQSGQYIWNTYILDTKKCNGQLKIILAESTDAHYYYNIRSIKKDLFKKNNRSIYTIDNNFNSGFASPTITFVSSIMADKVINLPNVQNEYSLVLAIL